MRVGSKDMNRHIKDYITKAIETRKMPDQRMNANNLSQEKTAKSDKKPTKNFLKLKYTEMKFVNSLKHKSSNTKS